MLAITACDFCEFFAKGLPRHGLYLTLSVAVVLDRESLGFGHCMVIGRSHVQKIYELTEPLYAEVFDVARRLAPHLELAAAARAVAFVSFGTGMPHAHVPLV